MANFSWPTIAIVIVDVRRITKIKVSEQPKVEAIRKLKCL